MSEHDDGPDPAGQPTLEQRSALLTALTTEHFIVQTAASTTVNESVGRAATFLGMLSSSLIAVGFTADRPGLLGPLLLVLVPTVFVLGLFTVTRLVDTGVENVAHLSRMAEIRGYYATVSPDAARFFRPAPGQDNTAQALRDRGLKPGPLLGIFTIATMIAVVDAVVGGTAITLVVALPGAAGGTRLAVAIASGLALVATYLTVFLRYQNRRYRNNER